MLDSLSAGTIPLKHRLTLVFDNLYISASVAVLHLFTCLYSFIRTKNLLKSVEMFDLADIDQSLSFLVTGLVPVSFAMRCFTRICCILC